VVDPNQIGSKLKREAGGEAEAATKAAGSGPAQPQRGSDTDTKIIGSVTIADLHNFLDKIFTSAS
jgi:hypothetical protein